MKLFIPMLILLLLSGCAALPLLGAASTVVDLVTPSKPSSGINTDVELVIGDQDKSAQLGDQLTANTISIVNETDPFMLALIALGFLLPSPGAIWRGLTDLIPGRRKRRGNK